MRHLLHVFLVAACGMLAAPAAGASAPELKADTEVATAGYYKLIWTLPGEVPATQPVFQLQEASSPEFAAPDTRYTGPDTATQLSGQSDGEYFYRIRTVEPETGAWSEPVKVEVSHHSLGKALGFFAVGLIVFLGTLALIVTGSRAAR